METKNHRAALLAFAKTLEKLVERNLIIEDSAFLTYDGLDERLMDQFPKIKTEAVGFGFNTFGGFSEIYKEEYERIKNEAGR